MRHKKRFDCHDVDYCHAHDIVNESIRPIKLFIIASLNSLNQNRLRFVARALLERASLCSLFSVVEAAAGGLVV